MKKYSIKNENDKFILNKKQIKNFIVFNKLNEKLYIEKNKIDNFKNWESIKKRYNKYEYIYSSIKCKNICSKKPISRSYFKLCEILNEKRKDVFSLIPCPYAPSNFCFSYSANPSAR